MAEDHTNTEFTHKYPRDYQHCCNYYQNDCAKSQKYYSEDAIEDIPSVQDCRDSFTKGAPVTLCHQLFLILCIALIAFYGVEHNFEVNFWKIYADLNTYTPFHQKVSGNIPTKKVPFVLAAQGAVNYAFTCSELAWFRFLNLRWFVDMIQTQPKSLFKWEDWPNKSINSKTTRAQNVGWAWLEECVRVNFTPHFAMFWKVPESVKDSAEYLAVSPLEYAHSTFWEFVKNDIIKYGSNDMENNGWDWVVEVTH